MHRTRHLLFLVAIALLLPLAHLAPAAGEGLNLDGRLAPELTFTTGMNGIAPGTSLSSFRGKVVWLKFILRDCPRCRATLPHAQELHERWGGSGLVVLAVVHQYGPDEMAAFLSQNGYTFPVGTDRDGSLAARYGVQHRPADYVIGIDGRIVASNAAPDTVLRTELGRYRLARLGAVPAEMNAVRDAVWNWDYGTALRTTEAAVAAGPDVTPEVRALDERVRVQAREELEARLALAGRYEGRRDLAGAQAIYDRVVEHFRGTSLEAVAAAARAAFQTRHGAR